jgi:iron complex outermembrane receptor protein
MEITDRIVLTGEFNSEENPTTQQDITIANLLASKGVGRAAFFTNAVDTRTQGIDLVTSYHHKWAEHDFRFVLAANFNQNRVIGNIKTTPLLQGKESTYFSREDISHIEQGAPQTKVTFSINWKYQKMWAMLRNVYFGQVAYIAPYDDPTAYDYNTDKIQSLDQIFTPKVVTDLTIGYKVAQNINFSIGASNLLNVYPDKQTHSANNFYGQFPYSIYVQQFGVSGAYYFARLSYDLRTNTK